MPELLLAARAMKARLECSARSGRGRGQAGGQRGRHGQGRPARHRQEPRRLDARRRRASRSSTSASTLTPQKFVAAIRGHSRRSLPVRPADSDHAGDEDDHRSYQGGRPARRRKGAGRRRAVNEKYAKEIGADGYGATATDAVAARPPAGRTGELTYCRLRAAFLFASRRRERGRPHLRRCASAGALRPRPRDRRRQRLSGSQFHAAGRWR